MGLFSKKKKQNTETNEINNRGLKEQLASTALQTLQEGVDYKKLELTECEFGYLFMIENHGLEALYKIKTDLGTHYFAAQGNSVMRLKFAEDLYQTTVEGFLSLHQ